MHYDDRHHDDKIDLKACVMCGGAEFPGALRRCPSCGSRGLYWMTAGQWRAIQLRFYRDTGLGPLRLTKDTTDAAATERAEVNEILTGAALLSNAFIADVRGLLIRDERWIEDVSGADFVDAVSAALLRHGIGPAHDDDPHPDDKCDRDGCEQSSARIGQTTCDLCLEHDQEAHAADDPHCTCNDCLAVHIAAQTAGMPAARAAQKAQVESNTREAVVAQLAQRHVTAYHEYPGFLAVHFNGRVYDFGTANASRWCGNVSEGPDVTTDLDTGVPADCTDPGVIADGILSTLLDRLAEVRR